MGSTSEQRAAHRSTHQRSNDDKTADPTARVFTHKLWLPALFTLALFSFWFVSRVQENIVLSRSIVGAAFALALWHAALLLGLKRMRSKGAVVARTLEVVLRPQHYVQAAVQFSVYAYWGYHWQPVYDHAWHILAQLAFAYAFDILLTWSRRERYILGFGAFPIVFSTNLFLWFKDDWFYLQFLMIAVGLLGKEFVRWNRDNLNVHIFNPSAFTLAFFSLALIATGTTELTWGPQIASTLTLAPHIYTFLFAVGLVVMYFFAITPIAGAAAAVLFGLSAVYESVTGVPYFLDSEVPAAVFLGLHLLVTDPSTSPRTPLGKAMFGALYGIGVFALYTLLDAIGAPTFYDKLLCVPLLNLSVIGIDRLAQRLQSRLRLERISRLGTNAAHMAVWVLFFGAMTALGKADGKHTGDSLPFWERACVDNRSNACERLLKLETSYCADNSAWACNELGTYFMKGNVVARDAVAAERYFAKACELRLPVACSNVLNPEEAIRADPRVLDLRLLLRERGKNLLDTHEAELFARACEHGWMFACDKKVGSR
jgi:hypothetical protein